MQKDLRVLAFAPTVVLFENAFERHAHAPRAWLVMIGVIGCRMASDLRCQVRVFTVDGRKSWVPSYGWGQEAELQLGVDDGGIAP